MCLLSCPARTQNFTNILQYFSEMLSVDEVKFIYAFLELALLIIMIIKAHPIVGLLFVYLWFSACLFFEGNNIWKRTLPVSICENLRCLNIVWVLFHMTLWKKTYFLILSKALSFMIFHFKMVEIPEKQVTLHVIHEYFLV